LTVAIAGAIASVACAWAANLEHTLVADHSEQDFGTLRQGAMVDAQFRLTNRSFRTVEIDGVSPNCDCAGVDVSPKHLEMRRDSAGSPTGWWASGAGSKQLHARELL
jgi:hypothetical protein